MAGQAAQERRTSRPRAHVRGDGREVVLAAALELFQQLGYHATSMRDIAREAGVTAGSIYHHFPSKQEILQVIMEKCLRDVISATRQAALQSGPEPAVQLAAIVRAWIMFHCTRRAEALVGATELRSLDSEGRRRIVALRDEQEALFSEVIERGCAQGDFATQFPTTAARAILNMGSAVAAWYDAAGPLTPPQMAAEYADLALGLVRSTGPGSTTPS